MRIDRTHKPWLWASAGILAAATLLYAFFRTPSALGSQGGTPVGLAFGVVGFAFMIFAALLGARKKVPVWRVGRAQTWMRGHLWLGPSALPLILFHGGFHFGGTLTSRRADSAFGSLQLRAGYSERPCSTTCLP